MFDAVAEFYRKFFFRPRKIASIVGEMLRDWNQLKVRLGEARDFFHYLGQREDRRVPGASEHADRRRDQRD